MSFIDYFSRDDLLEQSERLISSMQFGHCLNNIKRALIMRHVHFLFRYPIIQKYTLIF